MANINNQFRDFLKAHKVMKVDKVKKDHTHTSFGDPFGSYKIPDEHIDTFHKLYDNELQKKSNHLHMIERHREYSPILIDIDEKYDISVTERQHTEDHIKLLSKMYIDEICETFNIESSDKSIKAFIFEKNNIKIPSKKSEKFVKDGIHIMFPFIISDKYPQFLIRKNIIKRLRSETNIISELPLQNDLNDLIDKAVVYSNGWFMFGSTKPNAETYQLKYIFDGEMNKISPEEHEWNSTSLAEFFSIRRYSESDAIPLRESALALVDEFKTKKRSRKRKSNTPINNKELVEIINLLSVKRATDYSTWVEVGLCLHNIDPDNKAYLHLWDNFSKKSDKYEEGYCETTWDNFTTMKNGGLGIGSLYYFAKQDNNSIYRAIMRKGLGNIISSSIDSSLDYDLAKVLYEMNKNIFVCGSSVKSGTWYMFEEHKWVRMETNIELYNKISTEMCEEYVRELSNCNIESSNMDISEEAREASQKRGEKILKVINKLKTNSSKKSIIDECKTLFYYKDFENKLDVNPYLIGFNNGIYDLNANIFREGRPDDYVTMTTGTDYQTFDVDDPNWEDLRNFIETVFPDVAMKDYFLTFLASCLEGVNKEEKFRIWVGSGSNGKSKIQELFNLAYGEYCMKFPISLLTGKRPQSNACSPEVIRSKGKRFCYFEEPNENEKINTGRLKEFTGGDKIEGRALYKGNVEFKPQFKLSVLTNYLFEVSATDSGLWRRLEVIEFKSKFKDDPNENEKYEFPIDRSISEKMCNWKELFMSYLLDVYYKKYKKYGIIIPEDVKKHTDKYQKECDRYGQFVVDVIVHTKNYKDMINITILHDHYKFWHTQNNNDNKFMSKTDFRKYLLQKFGKKNINSNNLHGYTINHDFEKSMFEKISNGKDIYADL
jgi:P4 family phage/plasmid primase-like protien